MQRVLFLSLVLFLKHVIMPIFTKQEVGGYDSFNGKTDVVCCGTA